MEPIYAGASISWEIRGDTLYLEGSGRMDFRKKPDSDIWDIPWYYLDFIHVRISDSITSIGPEAFHTSDLVDVIIPDSVTEVGPLAFCKCQDLETAVFGKGIVSIGEYAFADCLRLKEAVLGVSVEVLGYHAFENCPSLCRFIPSPVLREIGESAFFGDRSLREVSLPSSLEAVDGNPFACCISLGRITLGDGNPFFSVRNNSLLNAGGESLICVPCAVREYVFPEGVRSVGRDAFRGGSVKDILLPDSVLHIDNGAFRDCPDLEKADISRIVVIPGDCFASDVSLTFVSMGHCVRIGPGAFRGCVSLESLKVPEKTEILEEGAFSGCTGLREVSFNDGLTVIGMSAFSGCSGLQAISLPESVADIGAEAFYGCICLKKAVLPYCFGDEEDYLPPETEIEYLNE